MKYLSILLFSMVFLFGSTANATIASTAVWQAMATGSDNNGGYFDPGVASPGTNYSTQASAQYNFTDLASSNGTTNPCVVTSASHNFVAADVGNSINVSAGTNWTTAARYTIVSVSSNAATLDKACGSSASLSSGTWYEGGALGLASANTATIVKLMQSGNKLWIKSGTYSVNGTVNLSATSGTASQHIVIEGYNSSVGDKPLPGSANQPNISGGILFMGQYWELRNVYWHHTSGPVISNGGNNQTIIQSKIAFLGTAALSSAIGAGVYWNIIGCEIEAINGYGISHGGAVNAIGNYIHDSYNGIYNTNGSQNYSSTYANNVFDSNSNAGVAFSGTATANDVILNNTFFGGTTNQTGYGVSFASGVSQKVIIGNIFSGLSTALNATDSNDGLSNSSPIYSNWNDFNNNGTNYTNVPSGPQDVTSNPTFSSISQLTGSAGVVSGSTLAVSSVTGVVANRDVVYISSGTGVTTGQYLITSIASTTLTLNNTPGGSGTNIHYQITTGHNLTPTANVLTNGLPFANSLVTNYQPIGSIIPQYTDPGTTHVVSPNTYIFGGATKTGSASSSSTHGGGGFGG
jgi:hypothetical protein